MRIEKVYKDGDTYKVDFRSGDESKTVDLGSKETCESGGAGWTTAQINLLDTLFSAIPWTTSTAGGIADSLIASLLSTSSGGGSGGEGEDNETDNITQYGSTLIITSLATAPTQSGGVLTIV